MNPDMFISSFVITTEVTNKQKKLPCNAILFFLQVSKAWLFDAQFIIYFMMGSRNK